MFSLLSALGAFARRSSISSLFHLKQHTPNICIRNIDDEWMVLLLFSILLVTIDFARKTDKNQSFASIL